MNRRPTILSISSIMIALPLCSMHSPFYGSRLGDTDALGETDGETLVLGETDGETDGLTLELGLTLALGETDGDTDGLTEAEGEGLGLPKKSSTTSCT